MAAIERNMNPDRVRNVGHWNHAFLCEEKKFIPNHQVILRTEFYERSPSCGGINLFNLSDYNTYPAVNV